MATCRMTDRADLFGIDAILFGMGSQKSDGRFAVLNLSRKGRFSAQAIGNRGRDKAPRCECLGWLGMIDSTPFPPTPAVNANNRR